VWVVARPKSVPDAEILAAAARVVDRVGPHRMTLAEVGTEVGLSAPALIQRFGSKRALLLAVAATGPSGVARAFRDARAAEPRPLDAIARAFASATQAHSPENVAMGLAFLQVDVTDAEFRAHARATFDALEAETRALLEEAKARGDVDPAADAAGLARLLVAVANGAILVWAIRQEGTADAAIRRDVEPVLAPYRLSRAR
jgi:AcrR family transcriptional regulator